MCIRDSATTTAGGAIATAAGRSDLTVAGECRCLQPDRTTGTTATIEISIQTVGDRELDQSPVLDAETTSCLLYTSRCV